MSKGRDSRRILDELRPMSPGRYSRLEEDVNEELAFHLECRADELRETGLDEGEARARALEAFGNVPRHRRACLDVQTGGGLRAGARRVAANLVVGVTLALLIATAWLFYSITLRSPVSFQDGGAWMLVVHRYAGSTDNITSSTLDEYELLAARDDLFAKTSAARYQVGAIELRGRAHPVQMKFVIPEYFERHGVRPVLGRFFDPDDIGAEAEPVVLSEDFWTYRLEREPGILGRTITLDQQTVTVIGVAPSKFQMYNKTGIFRVMNPEQERALGRRGLLAGVQTLPGVSSAAASAAINDLLNGQAVRDGVDQPTQTLLTSLSPIYAGPSRNHLMAALFLLGAVSLIGLLGSLRYLRHAGRQNILTATYIAVGLALILVQPLGSLLLGNRARLFDLNLPGATGAWMMALFALVGVALELWLSIEDRPLQKSPISRLRTGSAVVIIQFALVLTVVASAVGYLMRPPDPELAGLEAAGLVQAHYFMPTGPNAEEGNPLSKMFLEMESMPEIARASVASVPFFSDEPVPRIPLTGGNLSLDAGLNRVGTDFFETVSWELSSGQSFSELDQVDLVDAVILGQSLAERLFPGQDAVGSVLEMGPNARKVTVRGIVADVPSLTAGDMAYVWFWAHPVSRPYVLVRSDAPVETASNLVIAAATSGHSRAAITAPVAVEALARERRDSARLRNLIAAVFAIGALALSFMSLRTLISDYGIRRLRERSGARSHLAGRILMIGLALIGTGICSGVLLVCGVLEALPASLASVALPAGADLGPAILAMALVSFVAVATTAAGLHRSGARTDFYPGGSVQEG